MSQENVEIVRAAIDAFNRGDWESVLCDVGPEAELDLSRAVGPAHGVYGVRQWARFMPDFAENWNSLRIDPHEFIEAEDQVVVPWTLHATGRDGIEVVARVTWVFTVREGALQGATMYQERQDALEATGLPE